MKNVGLMIDSTMTNVKTGTKGLNEVIEVCQTHFLLRGYFIQKKAEDKKIRRFEEMK
jgi:phospholipid/cholesterol/gamma-HCH transport system substrate-binding protein